jgi:Protein of unknown function (DUF3303)
LYEFHANHKFFRAELLDRGNWGVGARHGSSKRRTISESAIDSTSIVPLGRNRDEQEDSPMNTTLYMVVEHFKGGDAIPVYRRFRDGGRLAPEGLSYISSWVDTKLERCFQLMETRDPALLNQWLAQWSDLVDFEVLSVISSAEAAERIAPRL